MNHWLETSEILARLAALPRDTSAAIATVARVVGSSYRRPGAKLLVEMGGAAMGGVSGGCLEADVREVAQAVMATGIPTLRTYDTSDEHAVWGLGLGCNGRVEVFVQPATAGAFSELAAAWRERLEGDDAFAMATLVRGAAAGRMALIDAGAVTGSLGEPALTELAAALSRAALASGSSATHALGDDRALFIEAMQPPLHLLVCGAGDDAQPLVAYATDAGFRVTVADHRPGLLTRERFPRARRLVEARAEDPVGLPPAARCLAVVKTHSYPHDTAWVACLLAAGHPYVGVLGPRERTQRLLSEVGVGADERIFGPVGLDLGAEGARQVAISIVAELLAFAARREPRPLSVRREAIHAR